MTDTLIQISAKYGQCVDSTTGQVVKLNGFIGLFEIYDEVEDHNGTVRVYQTPCGSKVVFIGDVGDHAPLYMNESSDDESIGSGIWLSSLVLSSWIAQNREFFCNKRVLELGAGIGLCGLTVACVGHSRHITLTDNNISLFACLKNNIEQNSCNLQVIPSLQKYDWNYLEQIGNSCSYDIVIISDCLYHNTKDILLDAILYNLKVGGVLAMANPPETSRPGFDEFLYALQEHGRVTVQRQRLVMNNRHSKSIWFVLFKRL